MFSTWWQIRQAQRRGMKSARFAANPKMNTIQKKSRIVPWNWLRRDLKDTVICAVWPSLKVACMTDAENAVNGILWQVIRWAIKENSSGQVMHPSNLISHLQKMIIDLDLQCHVLQCQRAFQGHAVLPCWQKFHAVCKRHNEILWDSCKKDNWRRYRR